MTNDEKMLKIVEKLQANKVEKDAIKKKFKDKDKVKKLTDKERLDHIEELLGL